MTKSQDKTKVLARLKAFRVPSQTAKLVFEQIESWIQFSGPEWTVSRLKELRVDFVRRTAGLSPVGSYAKHSDNSPVGPFRYFFRSERIKHRSFVKNALKSLGIYKSMKADKPTRAQLRKFYESVQRSPSPIGLPLSDKTKVQLGNLPSDKTPVMMSVESGYYRNVRPGRKDEFETWINSPSRKAPGIEFTEPAEPDWQPRRLPKKKKERDIELSEHLNYLLFPELNALRDRVACMLPGYARDYVRSNFPRLKVPHDLIPDMVREFDIGNYGQFDVPFHVGVISYIQEPGFKLRAVANPARVWQYILAPLGDTLFSMLRRVKSDFTFDQEAGVKKVQSFLQSGDTVHSVDISDATNNFPLSYTISVLQAAFADRSDMGFLVNLFRAISSSPWLTPEGRLVQWTVGQPLGLYPSFAAFALSHHALLKTLKERVGGSYALLGDDVVIKGEGLHREYLKALKDAEIPVSMQKCIDSSILAEFAGKTITPESVFSGHKYARITPDSFFDLCEELGPRFVKTLPKRYRSVIDRVSFLPQPFGFGWNPSGVPLADRIKGIEDDYLGGRMFAKACDRKFVDVTAIKRLFETSISYARNLQALAPMERTQALIGGRTDPDSPELLLLRFLADSGMPVGENLRVLERSYRSSYRDNDGRLVINDTEENRVARDLFRELTSYEPVTTPTTRLSSIIRLAESLDT